MCTMQIKAKSLLARIDQRDANMPRVWKCLLSFRQEQNVENILLTPEGHILFSSDKAVKLNAGMNTLKTLLVLDYAPVRNGDIKHLPYQFIQEYSTNDFDPLKIVYRTGKMFEDASLKEIDYSVME